MHVDEYLVFINVHCCNIFGHDQGWTIIISMGARDEKKELQIYGGSGGSATEKEIGIFFEKASIIISWKNMTIIFC